MITTLISKCTYTIYLDYLNIISCKHIQSSQGSPSILEPWHHWFYNVAGKRCQKKKHLWTFLHKDLAATIAPPSTPSLAPKTAVHSSRSYHHEVSSHRSLRLIQHDQRYTPQHLDFPPLSWEHMWAPCFSRKNFQSTLCNYTKKGHEAHVSDFRCRYTAGFIMYGTSY